MRRWVAGAVVGIALVLGLGAWAHGFEGSVTRANAAASKVVENVKPPEFAFKGGPLKTTVEAVLYDEANGTSAVVVEVQNPDPKRPILSAPIKIELLDEAGKVIGSNATAGTEPILNQVPSLPPDGKVLYVNDTISPEGTPASARVKATGTPTDARLQKFEVKGEIDESVYGASVVGTVLNPGPETRKNVRVEAVVTKGGKVVAAGGALIDQLEANATGDFQIFLIGDPKGGKLTVWAPPV